MPEFDLVAADKLIAARTRGEKMACERGCSWCCHQLIVMTNRDDGIAMLRAVREQLSAAQSESLELAIRAQAAEISQLSYEDAEAKLWTCPFLRNHACSIYAERPTACRAVFSRDASCCKAMMNAEDFEELSDEHQALATEIGERAMALQFEINDRRPVTGAMEMRQLLVELLDEGF